MNRIQCKACGTFSMMPLDVIVEEGEQFESLLGGEQESRFYSCHVCGDNWLSVRESGDDGEARIMFLHQMGMSPTLKRIALVHEDEDARADVEFWEYYVGDEAVEQDAWEEVLVERRSILKSVCSN
jgi:hypothetical protein